MEGGQGSREVQRIPRHRRQFSDEEIEDIEQKQKQKQQRDKIKRVRQQEDEDDSD